jgi:hypothetical protein
VGHTTTMESLMTYKDKLKIAQAIGSIAWKMSVFVMMIATWIQIIGGLINKDYMQVLAWAALRVIVSLNEIEEKL